MLTDIFAERYADVPIWQAYGESERRLLVQAFRIVSEQLFPYFGPDGKEKSDSKVTWKSIHDRLSMELGVQELAPQGYWVKTQMMGNEHTYWQQLALVQVCNNFVCAAYDSNVPADRFIKERLSFVEIAFRDREKALEIQNANLPTEIAKAERDALLRPSRGIRLPGNVADGMRAFNRIINESFRGYVDEFNERLRRAGTRLNYHNGFIQISADEQVEVHIETPFWALVKAPKWANVDTDMKEALDRRDAGGRDPAFYAAKALESTIKIISAEKGWTRGDEKGAAGFINNLVSQKNGRFIDQWEGDALKAFFASVRNELGHGPGGQPMPELSPQQTDWAIEFCMSWTKSLIKRL
ncbi:MAG: hypothetical protein QM719_02970 [Thermomonas sp.]